MSEIFAKFLDRNTQQAWFFNLSAIPAVNHTIMLEDPLSNKDVLEEYSICEIKHILKWSDTSLLRRTEHSLLIEICKKVKTNQEKKTESSVQDPGLPSDYPMSRAEANTFCM